MVCLYIETAQARFLAVSQARSMPPAPPVCPGTASAIPRLAARQALAFHQQEHIGGAAQCRARRRQASDLHRALASNAVSRGAGHVQAWVIGLQESLVGSVCWIVTSSFAQPGAGESQYNRIV